MRTGIFADILVGKKIPIGDGGDGKLNFDQGALTSASDRYITQGSSMTGPFAANVLATRMIGGYRYAQVESTGSGRQPYSENLDSLLAIKTYATVASNATTSPIGTTTADKLEEDTTNGQHGGWLTSNANFTAGLTYVFSIVAKAKERSKFYFGHDSASFSSGTKNKVSYDFATDTLATYQGVPIWKTRQLLSDGWVKVSFASVSTGGASTGMYYYMMDGINNSYQGVTGYGMYFWGAEIQEANYSTSYIPITTSIPITRAKDVLIMPNAVVPSFLKSSTTPFTTNLVFNNYSSTQLAADAGKKYLFSVDGTSDMECYFNGADGKIYIDQGGNKFVSTAKTWAMGANPKISIIPDNGSSECRVITSGFATGNGTESGAKFVQQADGIWSVGSKFGTDDQQLDGMIAEFRQGLV